MELMQTSGTRMATTTYTQQQPPSYLSPGLPSSGSPYVVRVKATSLSGVRRRRRCHCLHVADSSSSSSPHARVAVTIKTGCETQGTTSFSNPLVPKKKNDDDDDDDGVVVVVQADGGAEQMEIVATTTRGHWSPPPRGVERYHAHWPNDDKKSVVTFHTKLRKPTGNGRTSPLPGLASNVVSMWYDEEEEEEGAEVATSPHQSVLRRSGTVTAAPQKKCELIVSIQSDGSDTAPVPIGAAILSISSDQTDKTSLIEVPVSSSSISDQTNDGSSMPPAEKTKTGRHSDEKKSEDYEPLGSIYEIDPKGGCLLRLEVQIKRTVSPIHRKGIKSLPTVQSRSPASPFPPRPEGAKTESQRTVPDSEESAPKPPLDRRWFGKFRRSYSAASIHDTSRKKEKQSEKQVASKVVDNVKMESALSATPMRRTRSLSSRPPSSNDMNKEIAPESSKNAAIPRVQSKDNPPRVNRASPKRVHSAKNVHALKSVRSRSAKNFTKTPVSKPEKAGTPIETLTGTETPGKAPEAVPVDSPDESRPEPETADIPSTAPQIPLATPRTPESDTLRKQHSVHVLSDIVALENSFSQDSHGAPNISPKSSSSPTNHAARQAGPIMETEIPHQPPIDEAPSDRVATKQSSSQKPLHPTQQPLDDTEDTTFLFESDEDDSVYSQQVSVLTEQHPAARIFSLIDEMTCGALVSVANLPAKCSSSHEDESLFTERGDSLTNDDTTSPRTSIGSSTRRSGIFDFDPLGMSGVGLMEGSSVDDTNDSLQAESI